MTEDQRQRLQHIADVTLRLDGCPMGAMPECGDLIEMGLVTLHDHPKALMLWVEPSRAGWEALKALSTEEGGPHREDAPEMHTIGGE